MVLYYSVLDFVVAVKRDELKNFQIIITTFYFCLSKYSNSSLFFLPINFFLHMYTWVLFFVKYQISFGIKISSVLNWPCSNWRRWEWKSEILMKMENISNLEIFRIFGKIIYILYPCELPGSTIHDQRLWLFLN